MSGFITNLPKIGLAVYWLVYVDVIPHCDDDLDSKDIKTTTSLFLRHTIRIIDIIPLKKDKLPKYHSFKHQIQKIKKSK